MIYTWWKHYPMRGEINNLPISSSSSVKGVTKVGPSLICKTLGVEVSFSFRSIGVLQSNS